MTKVNIRALSARMRAALRYVKLLVAWERDRAQLKRFTAELAQQLRLEQTATSQIPPAERVADIYPSKA